MQTNTPYFDPADIEKNKTMGGLAYILFFLPLIVCPDSQYAKFHANQGLLNALAGVALWIIGFIPIIGWLIGLVGGIMITVFTIMGLINGFQGQAKRMPLYGNFDIIK